jgi:hypothetical protein
MYRLRELPEEAVSLQAVAVGAKTQGQADIVNGKPGFWFEATADGATGTFIVEAEQVLVDVDSSLTYSAGDVLYEHATVPTGVLNKTSSSRTKMGYALKSYAANTAQVLMRLTGGLN